MKKIIALILAVAMLLSMSLCLVSCNDDTTGDDKDDDTPQTETKVTYTVTVLDGDGNPVRNVELTFSPKGATAIPFKTDLEGKASYKTAKELSVSVTSVPAGYTYDNVGKALSFGDDGNLTIIVNKLAPLVILVVDQNGDPVVGAKVQMCDTTGSCRIPVTTDAEGKGTYNYENGEFKAQISNGLAGLPEGYTMDNPEEYVYFVDGVATITVTKIAD